jgi:hypothetical protein
VLRLAWLLPLLLCVLLFRRSVMLSTAVTIGISASLVNVGSKICAEKRANAAANAVVSVAASVSADMDLLSTGCSLVLAVATGAGAAASAALQKFAAVSAASFATDAGDLTKVVRADARPATAAVLPTASSEPSIAAAAGRSRRIGRMSILLTVRT